MCIKKVGVFHNITTEYSPWSCAEGIAATLNQQGYKVFDFKNPRHTPPTVDILEAMDVIILSGPEHFFDAILNYYGEAWLKLSTIKVAWYTETSKRDDRVFDFGSYRNLADYHYFPAIQDAVEFDGIWLPFGVDTNIFRPISLKKKHQFAFIGSMYPKRQEYIKHLGSKVEILSPAIGSDQVTSLVALIKAYNEIDIFVNLPAYSRLLVTKITEVMACQTMIITPRLDDESAAQNMTQFDDGVHLVYYDAQNPRELCKILDYYATRPDARDAIAMAGWQEVTRNHTLSSRIKYIMENI